MTITAHGHPRARLSKAITAPTRLRLDWDWLRAMEVAPAHTPAEVAIRADRDGRD